MSTQSQSFPLQRFGQNADHEGNADQDEGYADPEEPLEGATKPGTKGSRKVQCWKGKNILITVTSLLGYLSLYTGVSMIAPFYPIEVSSTHFSYAPAHHLMQSTKFSAWEREK